MYVKAFIPKDTEYYVNGGDYPFLTKKTYYTTIDVEESDLNNEHWIKHLAKENLVKQIAKTELFTIKRWKQISLDLTDIKIKRTEN